MDARESSATKKRTATRDERNKQNQSKKKRGLALAERYRVFELVLYPRNNQASQSAQAIAATLVFQSSSLPSSTIATCLPFYFAPLCICGIPSGRLALRTESASASGDQKSGAFFDFFR